MKIFIGEAVSHSQRRSHFVSFFTFNSFNVVLISSITYLHTSRLNIFAYVVRVLWPSAIAYISLEPHTNFFFHLDDALLGDLSTDHPKPICSKIIAVHIPFLLIVQKFFLRDTINHKRCWELTVQNGEDLSSLVWFYHMSWKHKHLLHL